MAAQSTVLTEFSDQGNSRTYTTSTHTAVQPALVLQKRKVPSGATGVAEDNISVIWGTTNSSNVVIPRRVSFQVTIRRPVDGDSADVASALAIFRDIVAGDEFGNTVDTQEYLI